MSKDSKQPKQQPASPRKKTYRFDQRTEEEFKKDIKDRTLEERRLFFVWLDLLEAEQGERPDYDDTGCGKDGEFLEDANVTTNADYYVEGYGPIEVKFAIPMLTKNFHLKERQVKSYIEQSATVLMVNGAGEDVPSFTMISPDALQALVQDDDIEVVKWVGFGFKQSYRIPISRFVWRPMA